MFPPLSKSTYMYGLQCHKRLFLHRYFKDLANPVNEQQQAIFSTGTNVGVLAQSLFADGIDAQGNEPYHSMKTVKKTAELMEAKQAVIYEAAFQYNDVLCAVDILIRKGNNYYAYEVKSTNSVKPQHIEDAALQYYVLSNVGLNLKDFSILHFDRNYVRMGDLNLSQLFMATSVLEEVLPLQEQVSARIAACKKVLQLKQIPAIEMGPHCSKPYDCNFTQYCSSLELETLPSAADEPVLSNEIIIQKQSWETYTKDFEYPLFFFDFETIMYGVPAFNYSRPYQQIPFQYSLHVLFGLNQTPMHQAFLGDGLTDPRPTLIEQMIRDLGEKGSIITWNASFEKTVINMLAIDFPEYEAELNLILSRMVDLMPPFRPSSGIVYSEAFGGSYSIKNILPVLVPELSYQHLNIQEGGTASFTYGQLAAMDEATQAQTRQDLLAYCHLDTLAMLKIWERVAGTL